MKKYVLIFMVLFTSIQLFSQKTAKGGASYYADKFHGRTTANGEKYDKNKYTAAHRKLPFGTMVKVTNLANGKSVIVRVNDRGPFVKNRIIDVSRRAAHELDFIRQGVTKVKIEIIDKNQKTDKNDQKTNDKAKIEIKEIYQVNALKSFPKGYSIQVGTFKELVNLMELSENLSRKYKSQVFVEVGKYKKEKVYKISVGKLKTKKEAESLKLKIKKHYPDCFIVKF